MADLTKLVVRLEAQNTKYLKQLDQSQKAANNWRDKVEKQNKAVGVSFKQLAVGISAGAAAFTAWFKTQAGAIDQQAKLAQQVGISVDSLKGFRLEAELSGVSNQSFDKSLIKMVRSLGEASQGIGAAKAQLESLGISNKKFFALNPEQQFEVIADKIGGLATTQERAAAASGIFGRAGAELAVTFKKGFGAFGQATQDIKDLGVSLTKIDAAKVEAANDAFTRVKAATTGLSEQLAVQFAPIVEGLGQKLFDSAKEAGGLDKVARAVFQNIAQGAAFAGNAIRILELGWLGIKAAILSAAEFALKGFQRIGEGATFLYNFINEKVNLGKIFTNIATVISDVARKVIEGWEKIIIAGAEVANKLGGNIDITGLQNSLNSIKSGVADTFTFAKEQAAEFKPGLFLDTFAETFSEGAAKAREAVITLANEPLPSGAIIDWVDATVTAATERAQAAADATNEIQETALTQQITTLQNAENQKSAIIKQAELDRAEFEKATSGQKAKTIIGDAVKITQGVAQQSKALFKINKIAGIANAIVNTSEGITKALASYPPPVSFAMAALQAAAGFAQVSAIRSQSFSGGGGGTTPSAAGSAATINDTPVNSGFGADISGFGGAQKEININFDSTITDTTAVRNFITNELAEAFGDGVRINASIR